MLFKLGAGIWKPASMGGDQRSKALEAHAGMVLAAVDQTPDITIEELRVLLAEHDVTASHGAVWNLLARYGLTVKKKTAHASEQGRADVVVAVRHDAIFSCSHLAALQPDVRKQLVH